MRQVSDIAKPIVLEEEKPSDVSIEQRLADVERHLKTTMDALLKTQQSLVRLHSERLGDKIEALPQSSLILPDRIN